MAVGIPALGLMLLPRQCANYERAEQTVAIHTGEEVVVPALLHRIEIPVLARNEKQVDVQTHPMDCVANFRRAVRT